MLPIARQPQRPRASSQSVAAQAKYLVGRPTLRWVVLGLVIISTLWFLAPPFLFRDERHFGPPHIVEPIVHPGYVRPQPTSEIRPSYPASNLTSPRAEAVREAFLHAYNGYTKYAGTYDELRPISGEKVNNFNGWAVTLIDALDTLWIMGLHDQFHDAIPTVAQMSFLTQNKFAPFFETVIRVLGGLLSAYALSGEPVLLTRADDLGKALLPAFKTASGLPMYSVNTATGETRRGWTSDVLWSETMSCQMEYKYLAHLTGRVDYYHRVERVTDLMHRTKVSDGLFPTTWIMESGKPSNNKYSVGAYADSAYEYLLKQYLLSSQSEPKALEMYLKAAKGIIENLFYLSPTRNLLYVTDTDRGTPSRTVEHLSCFLPGLFALGAQNLQLPPADRELHQWAAQGLAYTCYISYADSATGLGPEEMVMNAWPPSESNGDPRYAGRWIDRVQAWIKDGRPGGVPPGLHEPAPTKTGPRDYRVKSSVYLLRPETVESFYLLWRTTGDEQWRDRGWEVFQALNSHTRTTYGFASIKDVDSVPTIKKDEMPSYFLAETLKYLYLLFVDEELIPLDRWVFNTEAHPLPVFEWTKWEKGQYGIPM
ncbi:glycoside hydrolase family 47 protein [Hydnomerulius pinastri MD-312]|uniref:alpha-1,2-Mannosidase n=1 Tax=Hydnomerulius pinastri MD-312 TaxID=994086 RepID=A0A0C9VNK4_9AGAM|nr:glycoside hydrolase family 47 protein [Hydnomerulius pinastri MD-312]